MSQDKITSTEQSLLGIGQWTNVDPETAPDAYKGYQHATGLKDPDEKKKRVASSEPIERFLAEKPSESGAVLMWLGKKK